MLRELTTKQTHQYWAWLIWGIAALSVPYQFILQSSTSVMIPMLMKQFNVTETGIGFLTSSYFYAYLLWLFPGLSFAFIAAFAGLWAVPTLQGIYGVNLEVAAMGSSMVFLGTVIGAPILGWLADRSRQRRLIMFTVTSINLPLVLIFVVVPLPLWLVFILLMMMGFLASTYVLAFAMVREITDINVRGSAMGFTNMMCVLIGAPLLQPFIGFVLRRHEHGTVIDITQLPPIAYQHALTSLLASLALALLVVLFIREKKSSSSTTTEFAK